MAKHTLQELRKWQALPLSIKVLMTKDRIRQWINEYGEDGVYVSFSGGKDSTVLLHLVRENYPNVKAVFVDTGLEYPEIREFVKTFDNVEWLRPKMNFRQVIEKYGYPFISKEVSKDVANVREFYKHPEKYKNKKPIPVNDGNIYRPYSLEKLDGTLRGGNSQFNQTKWKFLVDAEFSISDKCCTIMKKNPVYEYAKKTGKKPLTAQMASESRLRAKVWLANGCNAYDSKHPISNPMAFWTEQDILRYIVKNNIDICKVYGQIIEDRTNTEEVEWQMTISDIEGWEKMEEYDAERLPLKTTGCSRTGCMFCGYGCHLEKEGEGRFEQMRETHPKQYEYIMKPWKDGGLGYKEVIDWINEHGNINIRY